MTEKKKAGFWDLTKDVAKEAQKIVGNTIEGVKSASKEIKVEAHKNHLEHFEKIKKLEKRAKDAGISDEDLGNLKKDLGVTQGESEGVASVLDTMVLLASMGTNSIKEERFEQRIESIEKAQKMENNWKPKK
jgi:hypothetical protein